MSSKLIHAKRVNINKCDLPIMTEQSGKLFNSYTSVKRLLSAKWYISSRDKMSTSDDMEFDERDLETEVEEMKLEEGPALEIEEYLPEDKLEEGGIFTVPSQGLSPAPGRCDGRKSVPITTIPSL